MARIEIDGYPYEVDEGRNLLEAALSLHLDLPFFCWHPALGSVGACRQCAVKQYKDEGDDRGKIVMACMTPATQGTRISIDDADARAFRAGVVEWLMANHPHDCPVCDEGGECHLQDMTVMTGHRTRRFRFPKRTYRNQELGPFVAHEMNRCIQCYRCVRFYNDYAGGRDFGVHGTHDEVYFGRHADGVLESPFAGNLVEVCPTGVFTDKTLRRHYTRKWDLQSAPSICVHCGLGCNVTPGERDGTLRRIRARYHSHVNRHFICDRGRYGYELVDHERRVRAPLFPSGPRSTARVVTREEAVDRAAAALLRGKKVVGIGSPRASLESNVALRALVGPDAFHQGVAAYEREPLESLRAVCREGTARLCSLAEVEQCDVVVVLGEDVARTAPMLGLALRQASQRAVLSEADALKIPRWHDLAVREVMQGRRGPFFVATAAASDLDGLATHVRRAAPDDAALLGWEAAHRLDPRAPRPDRAGSTADRLADEIADAVASATRPLVVTGAASGNRAMVEAAAHLAWAAAARRDGVPAELAIAVPECNSLGLAMLGGLPLDAAFAAAGRGAVDAAIVLENDLFRRAERDAVDGFLAAVPHIVVLDHIAHDTAALAEIVLPTATFAEDEATYVNSEGRAQRAFKVMQPRGHVQSAWRWLGQLRDASGRGHAWESLEQVRGEMVAAIPSFGRAAADVPPAHRIPRQPHRWSGRTALHAARDVREGRPPQDPESPFVFSMEGDPTRPAGALVSELWAPGWSSVQSLHRFQEEVEGPLRGGDLGTRLIEPTRSGTPRWFPTPPSPFQPRPGEWQVVLLHHIFGSEELSALAPAVAQLTPRPYVALPPADMRRLDVAEGDQVLIERNDAAWRLPVRTQTDLVAGLLGVPQGLPGQDMIPPGAWVRVRRA